jgi:hypothetical protein
MLVIVIVMTASYVLAKPLELNLTPDTSLPWGGTITQTENAINHIYKVFKVPLGLCKTQIPGTYTMCMSKDGVTHGSSMWFFFENNQLIGYKARYSEVNLKLVLKLAKRNFAGGSRAEVVTQSRTFYVFEKQLGSAGWNELYIIHDKLRKVVRVHSRFIPYP